MWRTVQPCSSRNEQTSPSRSMLSASRQRSSVSGKCCPMSPSPAAPSSASMTACVSTSASECPLRPRSAPSISTPPSTSRRPSASRCESYPIPERELTASSTERLHAPPAPLEDRDLGHAHLLEHLHGLLVPVRELVRL